MSRESNLVKNTAILGIGAIFSKGLIFLMIPFFSRWLSVGDYGSFDWLSTYITLLIPFMTLSSGEAIFRFMLDAKQESKQKKIISSGLLIFAIGNTITIAAAMLYFLNTAQDVALPFCCFLFSEALNQFSLTYLRGIRRLPKYTVTNIISMVGIAAFVTLLVKFCGLGLPGMLYGYAAGYLSGSLYALLTTKFHRYLNFSSIDKKEIKSIVQYSAPLIPNAVSWWIINASDRTIIHLFLDAAANGIYGIAYKIPSLCTTLFGVFHVSWQENVSLAIHDDDRDQYISGVFSKMMGTLISICIVVLSADFIFFHYIFDIKYISGMNYVPILITSCVFTVISQFFGAIFIGLKQPKYNGGTSIMAAAINLIAHLLLIKSLGLYAAAVSTVLSFLALCIVRYCIIRKQFSLKVDKKTVLFSLLYVYFFITHYLDKWTLNWTNLAAAVILFFAVNREYIRKFIHKLLK